MFSDEFMYKIASVKYGIVQDYDEALWMLATIRQHVGFNISSVLELGVYRGGGICMLSQLFPPGRNGVVVGVDIDATPLDKGGVSDTIFPTRFEFIQGESLSPSVIEKARAYAPFDVVVIDTVHVYHLAEQEFAVYKDLTASPGVIVFHDIGYGYTSVVKDKTVGQFWNTVKWNYTYMERRTGFSEQRGFKSIPFFGTGILLV